MDVMASMAAVPQTMVQPGFLQSLQSRVRLVLHILLSGFGGPDRGILKSSARGEDEGLYQFSPTAPSGSFRSGSLKDADAVPQG